ISLRQAPKRGRRFVGADQLMAGGAFTVTAPRANRPLVSANRIAALSALTPFRDHLRAAWKMIVVQFSSKPRTSNDKMPMFRQQSVSQTKRG
ncbi:MAG: hypothetical protein ACPGVX_12625, partial [Thalassobaculaceae bacterium]